MFEVFVYLAGKESDWNRFSLIKTLWLVFEFSVSSNMRRGQFHKQAIFSLWSGIRTPKLKLKVWSGTFANLTCVDLHVLHYSYVPNSCATQLYQVWHILPTHMTCWNRVSAPWNPFLHIGVVILLHNQWYKIVDPLCEEQHVGTKLCHVDQCVLHHYVFVSSPSHNTFNSPIRASHHRCVFVTKL